ncbi:MAG: transcription repressor NadR [Oscillibacter sp.]|nr:transcription repressor NadR [Oscillibacter sp.]
MTAIQRRDAIFQAVSSAQQPLSATTLAQRFSVSRQVIVNDIALLRAAGNHISATPRGYLAEQEPQGLIRQVACVHDAADTAAELNAMVDCGCTVLDVIVAHPIYGQLTAPLQITSRYDVQQFLMKMKDSDALPLSMLTEGVHLHTLICPSEEIYLHLKDLLRAMGILLSETQ